MALDGVFDRAKAIEGICGPYYDQDEVMADLAVQVLLGDVTYELAERMSIVSGRKPCKEYKRIARALMGACEEALRHGR